MDVLPGLGGVLGGAAAEPSISFLNGGGTGVETSVHTRTAVDLGSETTGKSIYIALTFDYASARQCNSITIGGVAMTRLARAVDGASTQNAELWVLHDVTVTSANIVVTMNGATYGCTTAVYKGLNTQELSLLNSAVAASDATGTTTSASLTCATGNFLFAIERHGSSRNITWSGIATTDYLTTATYQSFASELPATSGTRTITVTFSTSTAYRRLLLCALG